MRLRELSIIQYQNVSTRDHLDRLWISVDSFKKQLEFMTSNSFKVLSINDTIDYMEKKTTVRALRPISLTFDNGYMDFYEYVFPLISTHNLPVTVLISPEKVGKSVNLGGCEVPYLTWNILRELVNSHVTIGAYEDYTWNIKNIPENLFRRHIIDFKKSLEDKLGIEIRYFGIKEGVPNHKIRNLLISTGYKAFLTECPTNRKPDLYSIGRIQVDDNDFNIFLTKTSKTYLFFKDRRSWKYIRKYKLDRVAHHISETYDRIRGVKSY